MKNIAKKPFIISVVIFVAALVFAFTLGLVLHGCDFEMFKTHTTEDFTYMSDISSVKGILNTRDKKYLLLVNKQNPLGETYVPEKLVDVDTSYTWYEKSIQLESATAQAAMAMIREMRAAGIDDVYITSGYRSYEYQKTLFDNYMYEEYLKDKNLTKAEREEKVRQYSAYPGESEHQSGLCVDFITSQMKSDLVNYSVENTKGGIGFAETETFEWLCENAHKFGFILRYPDGKTDETGYSYESWHYRFVGIDAATKIHNSGKTLEEWVD